MGPVEVTEAQRERWGSWRETEMRRQEARVRKKTLGGKFQSSQLLNYFIQHGFITSASLLTSNDKCYIQCQESLSLLWLHKMFPLRFSVNREPNTLILRWMHCIAQICNLLHIFHLQMWEVIYRSNTETLKMKSWKQKCRPHQFSPGCPIPSTNKNTSSKIHMNVDRCA